MDTRSRDGKVCIYVTGFDKDIDRKTLYEVFNPFGKITKLFIQEDGRFAKVYYGTKEECAAAVVGLRNNPLNWNLKLDSPYSDHNFVLSDSSDSGSMMDSELNENLEENQSYVDVHGRPLTVFQSQTGNIFVPLKEIRKTGFAIFRKENYDPILADTRQIREELTMHLLAEARTYLLKNKVMCVDENQIVQTIKRCEQALLNDASTRRNRFTQERTVEPTRNSLIISKPNTSIASPPNNARSPRQLANNFSPSNSVNDNRRSTPQNSNFRNSVPTNLRKPKNFVTPVSEPQENADYSRKKSVSSNDDSFEQDGRNNELNTDFPKKTMRGEKSAERPRCSMSPRNLTSQPKEESQDACMSPTNLTSQPNEETKNACIMSPRNLTSQSKEESKNALKEELVDEIEKTELESGINNVLVSFYDKQSRHLCWVQLENNLDILTDLILKIMDLAPAQKTVEPVKGKLCLAEFEDLWYRAKIMDVNPRVKVHFIDFGNMCEVDMVKVIPAELKDIPAQAVKIAISNEDQSSVQLKDNMTLKVSPKKKYDDGTFVVKVDRAEKKNLPAKSNVNQQTTEHKKSVPAESKKPIDKPPIQNQMFSNNLKPLGSPENGEKVMLIGIEGEQVVIQSKDAYVKLREITEYIKNLDKNDFLLNEVKVGQLVLCCKDGMQGLFRASVTGTEGSIVNVTYVDYPGEESLSLKSLRNVDEFLANVPICSMKLPGIKGITSFETPSMDLISKLIEQKIKLTLIIENNSFDLKLPDGSLLSSKVRELDNPPKPSTSGITKSIQSDNTDKTTDSTLTPRTIETKVEPQTEQEGSEEKIMYDDMEFLKVEIGTNPYMCFTFKDIDEITILSVNVREADWLNDLSTIEVSDSTPYNPEPFEMCLALYKGEDDVAAWYRGVVTDAANGEYDVLFVDYGNTEKLKTENIRKFPAHLKEIPILGISCGLVGLPNKPAVFNRLKELIMDGDTLDINVKGVDSQFKHEIEVPAIYDILRKEGLID